MDGKKKIDFAAMIEYCICAVIWDISLIFDLVTKQTRTGIIVLHIVCTTIFDIVAIGSILRYRKSKRECGDIVKKHKKYIQGNFDN